MSVFNVKDHHIFIAVPRTGSTSMSEILGLSGHHDIMFYKQFVKHLSTGIEWNDIFKFAFVRNPFDRFVSSYSHMGKKKKDFKDFVMDLSNWWYTHDRQVQVLFKPQFRFLCNWGMDSQMDFIGKYERINEDWKIVAEKIGVSDKLPLTNESERTDWRDYYDDETLMQVQKKYEVDFHKWYL